MSGPKHLWAGDWERESEVLKPAPERLESEPGSAAAPGPPDEPPPPPNRRTLRRPLVLAAAVVLIAGAAIGLAALLGGGSQSSTTSSLASASTGVPTTPRSGSPQIPTAPTVPSVPRQGIPPQQLTPPQPQQQTIEPNPPSGPTVYWDGMQIETMYPGVVMITTVAIGTPGDRAGLNPGVRLIAVNGHRLSSANDIAPAIHGLPAGRQITVEVDSGGSGPESVPLALGAPPRKQP